MKLKLKVSKAPRAFDPAIQEMMDRECPDLNLLKDDLSNIRKLNRYLGAYRLISKELWILQNKFPHRFNSGKNQPVTILDFCTGSGDIPREVAKWARISGSRIIITATDVNPVMLEEARKSSADYPEINFKISDILKPDFSTQSFDFVFCNLALHHFSTEDAIKALSNMWRIARLGVIVNDLERTHFLLAFTKPFIRIVSKNEMTRHDAELSVQRAFTKEELLRLAFHARLPQPEHRRYFLSRQVLGCYKDSASI